MKVVGLQMDLVWEDCDENLRRAASMLEEAAACGARLAVLPEMFNTGFTMNASAAAAHADRTRSFLSEQAQARGLWVCAGYADPASPRPRNGCSIFDPAGAERLRYHKIHPFSLAGEHEHYDGGQEVATVEVEGLRVTPLVCYDLRFPEPFRAAAEDTDLFVVIANWPARRREAWRCLLRARAIENQCFVLGVNRVGLAGKLPHAGDSTVFDPLGETVSAAAWQVGRIEADVSAEEVRSCRETFSFLADRRPDVYDGLRP